jgi:hypothetical protein
MGDFTKSFYQVTYGDRRVQVRAAAKPVAPASAAKHAEVMLDERQPIPARIKAMNAVAIALGQKVPPGDCLGDFCVKFRAAFVF